MSSAHRASLRPARALALLGALALLLFAASPAAASRGASLDVALQAIERSMTFSGTAWGIDTQHNQVVVTVDSTVRGAKLARARTTVQRLGRSARLESVSGTFKSLITGGDAIYGKRYRCSLGFNVTNGSTFYFLTAGHCGKAESRWWTSPNRATFLGKTISYTFPGKDYAIVQYDPGYTDHPGSVDGNHDITAAADAYVNEVVTRTGSTTGTHTGVVTALNVTVRYQGGGLVRGLIQTTVCAEPGDSGGPLYDGSLALGLTSGGSGDCTKGGTTFFQPVIPALNAYGVQVY